MLANAKGSPGGEPVALYGVLRGSFWKGTIGA